MTVSVELVWLLNQLRNTPQLSERLRLVARSYRALRDLHPADRRRVAAELGFEGAEQLVEQLARRGGASPARLLEVLRRAESEDPGTLKRLLRGIVDPERRPSLIEHALDGAADWLAGEDSEGAGGREGEPTPTPAGTTDTLAAALGAAVRDAEESGRDLCEGAEEPTDDRPTDLGVAPAPPSSVPAPEELPTARRAAPPVPQPGRGPAHPRPPKRSAPAARERRREPAPGAAQLPGAEAKPHTTELGELPPADEGTPDRAPLVQRLRRLAKGSGRLTGAGLAELDRLLQTFPAGWARRRALEALLRAGIPTRIDEALILVGRLATPGERMWALTTLAACRELDDDERERLLAEAGSPILARRLRLRLRHA